MHLLLSGALVVVAFVSSPLAWGAGTVCPQTISVKQSGIAPAAEWSVTYSKSPVQLEMVSFYSGPPKDGASLMYDEMVNAMNLATATWKFPKQSRPYWLKCSYHGSTLELSKPLPQAVSSCLVTYNRESAPGSEGPYIKEVACK